MSIGSIYHRVLDLGQPIVERIAQWRRWIVHPLFLGSLAVGAGIAIYLRVQSNWKKAQEAKLKLEEEESKYQKARDTLIVWQTIAREIYQSTLASELKEALQTREQVLTKVNQFGRWLQENNSRLQQIRAIQIESQSLTSLPDDIEKLTNLVQLNLVDNRLTTLPPVISKLANLKVLNVSKNQLAGLPDAIGDLQKLTDLTLDHNKIQILPNSMRNLHQLKWFSLTNNRLAILPDWIKELTQLKRLFLTGNRLTALPKELPNLERIDINNNTFTTPPDLSALRNVHVVA